MMLPAFWRWLLFLTLLAWGIGYIALFAFFLSRSEDYIAARRRDAVCARGHLPAGKESISFASTQIDRDMVASGWSGPEDWGLWSAERRALLVLPTPAGLVGDGELEFDLLAPTNRKFPLATVDVSLAGRMLTQWQLREGVNKESSQRLVIPAELLAGRSCVTLELRFALAFRPSKQRLGRDGRLLGIGLKTVRWQGTAQNP